MALLHLSIYWSTHIIFLLLTKYATEGETKVTKFLGPQGRGM
jgi:hypothetical protein